jgi:type II secretory pathway component GspD/PulD (secretin)
MSARCRIVVLISAALLSAGVGRAEDAKMVQQVYQVADLIIPLAGGDKTAASHATAWAASREKQPAMTVGVCVSKSSPAGTLEEKLIKTITTTIAPTSWSSRGGRGTIEYFPLTLSLVVNQTPAVQEQIAGLLAALRRQQDMEVAVEVRLIEVAEDFYESLKSAGLLGEKEQAVKQVSCPATKGMAFLSHAQVCCLLETIQSDIRSNVMQAPKITMFNGQSSQINVVDEQSFVTGLEIVHCDDHIEYRPKTESIPLGTQMALRPIISADRRFVQLHLDLKLNSLVSDEVLLFPITTPVPPAKGDPQAKPQTCTQYIQQPRVNRLRLDRTLVLPDGGTAVLTGLTKGDLKRQHYEASTLSKVPYIGQLFRAAKSCGELCHVLVLVTPRIIVTEEKEEKTPHKAECPKVKACPCSRSDVRTPTVPAIREGERPVGEEPSDALILRYLPQLPHTVTVPGICEEYRDDIQIVKERIVDKIDEPRSFPLVGPAQLHHCHWKCTVYYHDTIVGQYPVPFRRVQSCVQVIYLDTDHLHLCGAEEGPGK